MIVRCQATTGAALPVDARDPLLGINLDTEYPVTVGRSYPVYGVTILLGITWYYILDDDELPWPVWAPAPLFDVIDGTLPNSWQFGYFRFSLEQQFPLLSFPEWAADHFFYERLVDGEEDAVRVFACRRQEVERLHPARVPAMKARTPLEDLLVGGLEDWVDAGWALQSARLSGETDPIALRDLTMAMIAEALREGLVTAGDIIANEHVQWHGDTDLWVERIRLVWLDEWRDEIPTPGAIVWLNNTQAGDQIACDVLAREMASSGTGASGRPRR